MANVFDKLAHEVVTARKNFGAPVSMQLKESVSTRELQGKTIVIDEVVVRNKKKYDKESKTTIKNKDGKDIYQPIVYVAYHTDTDKDKFFATKSAILVEQLERFSGQKLVAYEDKDFPIPDLKDCTIKVSAEKVKYRDGKEYDQLIFTDAE